MKTAGDRLASIDLLRGLAVLAVVCSHLPFTWRTTPERTGDLLAGLAFSPAVIDITQYGRFGVNLFLVISGFCIHLRWARLGGVAHDVDFLSFWGRRLLRLYPPYFLALLGSVLGLFILFGVIGHADTLPGRFGYDSGGQFALDLALLILLIQNFSDASQHIGNGPFWTLALEEQLYLLYFLLLAARKRFGWPKALAGVVAASTIWRLLPLIIGGLPASWYALGPSRWIEWALGALAVEAHFGKVQLPRWCSSLPAALALLLLAVLVNWPGLRAAVSAVGLVDDAAFGLAFFVLVGWLSRLERHGRLNLGVIGRSLAAVGLFSYSVYLVHEPAMVAVKQSALRLGLTEGLVQAIAMVVLRIGAALIAGYVFYRIIELRAIKASRQFARPTAVSSPATGAN